MSSNVPDSFENVAESLGSISAMYENAKLGDPQAADDLWEAYSKRLFGLARAVLRQHGVSTAAASEDSIVNVAFAKFFRAIAQGRYQDVADRHELWRLLAVITGNQARSAAKRAGKPGQISMDDESRFVEIASEEPTPMEVAAFSDTIDNIEQQIRARSTNEDQADQIIRVFHMRLSAYRQREIAEAIGCSEVTVRRHLKIIRELIQKN